MPCRGPRSGRCATPWITSPNRRGAVRLADTRRSRLTSLRLATDRRRRPRAPIDLDPSGDQTVTLPPLSSGRGGHYRRPRHGAEHAGSRWPEAEPMPELPALPQAELRKLLGDAAHVPGDPRPAGRAARLAMWPELADLHAALDQPADAAVCWLKRAVGARRGPAAVAARLAAGGAAGRRPAARLVPPGHDPERRAPTDDMVRHVAAGLAAALYLCWRAGRAARAGDLAVFLEVHEAVLPVRAAWLAWLGLTRLTGGDPLALAARDRLLRQLLDAGLSRDRDLPTFLRHSAASTGAAAAVDRERLAAVPQGPRLGRRPGLRDAGRRSDVRVRVRPARRSAGRERGADGRRQARRGGPRPAVAAEGVPPPRPAGARRPRPGRRVPGRPRRGAGNVVPTTPSGP